MNGPAKFAGPEQTRSLNMLQPQRWHNWGHSQQHMEDRRYTPTIWSPEWVSSAQTLKWLTEKYPDRTWLLLNEPDYPGQADLPASDAAVFTRHWTGWLGEARTALAGVTVSYHRVGNALRWLDDYLAAGGELPDAWHIHLYAPTLADWKDCYARWRAWYQQNGKNKPVILSETALFHTVSSAKQIEFMEYVYNLTDLEAVYWYGAIETETTPGLMTADGDLTELGEAFVRLKT